MKVSMDHYFSTCSGCPFAENIKEKTILSFDYFCRIEKKHVEGNTIPNFCPLKKDEEGKIYKIYAKDIQ